MKSDERQLLLRLAELQGTGDKRHPNERCRPEPYQLADAVGAELGIHHKRVNYLLLKWSDKGWWNYGVSARTGWLEPKGLEAASQLRNNHP